ncbi:MAG: histidine kinase dimerization/phospho-acceptor domain-containing protein, partial [Oscillospiraceae bacterium]
MGTAIIFLYIVYVFSKKRAGEHTVLTAALIAAFINAFGYTMVILSENIDSAASVKVFDITGSALALYLLYLFVGDLCRVKIPGAVSIILLIGDLIGIAAAASDRQLHFYYKNVVPVSETGFFAEEVEYAVGFYILMVSMIIQTLMIIFIAAYGCRKKRVAGSKHMMCVFLAVLLPSASMISYQFKLLGYFNPSSLVMGLTVIMINVVISHCQKSDVVTSARDSIIETMDDALIVTDLKMQVIDSNPAARRIFPVISGGSKWKPGDAMKLVADLVNENENTEFEIDGKYYEKHISRLYNSDGSAKGYSVLVLDVTETKKYVDQLIEMRKKADMANSAKSDFLANMSHEIRTPMNAITGFAELCLQEKNYTYASDIKTAAKNLISIINDILDISKIEAGKLELVPAVYNTEEMLNDVISIIYVQLGNKKNIDFKIDIDKRLPKKMFGDEVRIKQILINLLGNAVKFTKNGYIALSVKELSRDNDKISLMFKVSDTGIGIKKEDIPKLFENFQQVDTKKNREIEG